MRTPRRDGPMDDYLATLNLWRKPIAQDGSCLFRAVSEQLFHTQAFHTKVREACIQFMEKHREQFEAFIEGPFDHHLFNLQNPKEWAGQVEISALSNLYKRDFLVFQKVGEPPVNVTGNNYKEKIHLCFTGGNHYDCVYPHSHVEAASVCQSLVYELLYEGVFGMKDTVATSRAMVNSRSSTRRDSVCSEPERPEGSTAASDHETESGTGSVEKKEIKTFPFPHKVAKALDPEVYRNIEYDTWLEVRKDGNDGAFDLEFAIGDKCQVTLESDETIYTAFIQDISPDRGPVTVYVEELGERKTVPFASIKPHPQASHQGWAQVYGKNYRNLTGYYQKLPLTESDNGMGKKGKTKKKKEIPIVVPFGRGQGLPQRLVPPEGMGRGVRGRGITPASYRCVSKRCPTSEMMRHPFPCMLPPCPFSLGRHRSRNKSGPEDSANQSGADHATVNDLQKRDSDAFPALPNQGQGQGSNGPRSFWNGSASSSDKFNSSPHPAENSSAANIGKPESSHGSPYKKPPTPCLVGLPVVSSPNSASNSVPVMASGHVVHHEVATASSLPQAQYVPQMAAPVCAVQGQYPATMHLTIPHMETLQGPVNFAVQASRDPAGNDLPLNDPNTLRFFFNLGHEYYRQLSMIQMQPTQPGMYGGGPYMGPQAMAIPPVPVMMEAGAACANDLEPTGQCDMQVHTGVSSLGPIPHKRDVVSVRDLERSYDGAGEGDRQSPGQELPNNDSGCVSDVSSGNGEVVFPTSLGTLGNIYAQRHSISEISDHSDTSSQQSLSNSSQLEGAGYQGNQNKGSTRSRQSSGPQRNVGRPMRDIPPRFKKMLAQRSPVVNKYEGQPLMRHGGFPSAQMQDTGLMPSLDGDGQQYMPISCMECSVPSNPAYNSNPSYMGQPMPCMSSPYYFNPVMEAGLDFSFEGSPGEGYQNPENLDGLQPGPINSPAMYSFQMMNPDGTYEEPYMSNSMKSSPTGYMTGPGGAAPAQPQGVVYYSNPGYPSPAYMPYGSGPPVMYSTPQPVPYMTYNQPSTAS